MRVYQTGQTALSIAERLGFSAAVEMLRPVTSQRSQGSSQDAALTIMEPEVMTDLDSEDDAGMPITPGRGHGGVGGLALW